MSDLTRINTSLIEMDDVAEFLRIAKEFVTREEIETASNNGKVKKIAGIDSDSVARAVKDENGKQDHNTVNNSMHLMGFKADHFLTQASGDGIIKNSQEMKDNYSAEFNELRDEVYQLRMELAKSGVVTNYAPYAGFYDIFRNGKPAHEAAAVAVAAEDSPNQDTVIVKDGNTFDNFNVGDKIFLKSLETGASIITEVTEKTGGKNIKFAPSSGFDIKKGKCEIYKSKGNVINGTFTFGEITPERPGKKEFYTCLDDDTYRLRRSIKHSNTGYGCTFRIAARKQKSYLAKVDVQVKKYGNPGDMMCYIIDERDIPRWKNAAQAIADNDAANNSNYENTKYHYFAKSQPLLVDARLGECIATFNFYDALAGELTPIKVSDLSYEELQNLSEYEKNMLKANGVLMRRNQSTYPLLKEVDDTDHKIRYCMVIEALQADDSNYYDVVFMQNKKEDGTFGDLQLNNITFSYEAKDATSADAALISNKEINSSDLYYGITLVEAVTEAFTPYTNGIYSARFKTHDPIEVTKARLMLRIAREGMFSIDPSATSGDIHDNSTIVAKGQTNDDVDGFENSLNKDIVIGTEIRNVSSVQSNQISVKNGLHVEVGDPIYPIGYKVAINARLIEWNPTTFKMETKQSGRFVLPLSYVMPDINKLDDKISDRLIFEEVFKSADGKNLLKYNDFEIQIYWEKTCKEMDVNFAGRIHDLSLSLDRFM